MFWPMSIHSKVWRIKGKGVRPEHQRWFFFQPPSTCFSVFLFPLIMYSRWVTKHLRLVQRWTYIICWIILQVKDDFLYQYNLNYAYFICIVLNACQFLWYWVMFNLLKLFTERLEIPFVWLGFMLSSARESISPYQH